jgi:hypothetical protein
VLSRTAVQLIGGRYRIDGLLGQGGMARVFDAVDERLERRVAVKILHTETEGLPGMRRRFEHEARIAARLAHPNIVAVLDYGEDGASSYLVMERLPGATLRDEIDRGPLAPSRLIAVVSEVLAALELAHRSGVLHRDVKPSNVLLQDDGHVKLADFGIAKSVEPRAGSGEPPDDVTITGMVLGTPGYLAPERRSGGAATVQSDLFAVGAVIVESALGRPPLPDDPATPESLAAPFGEVARRALAIDPAERFPSAGDMRRALGATQPVPPATALLPLHGDRGTPGRTRRRRRMAALAVLSVVVLAAALVAALVPRDRPNGPAATSASAPLHAAAAPRVSGATATRPSTTTTTQDPEVTAIDALAASLAGEGGTGDAALAAALETTATEPAGPARQASAQRTLGLAGLLLDAGALTRGQYDDVATALAPAGAGPSGRAGTPPSAPAPAGSPGPARGGPAPGHLHGHDSSPGSGDQS